VNIRVYSEVVDTKTASKAYCYAWISSECASGQIVVDDHVRELLVGTADLETSYYQATGFPCWLRQPPCTLLMMMIAFITMNSGLVPLIEGLCAQIHYLRFEIIGGLQSHLLLFFFKRKIC